MKKFFANFIITSICWLIYDSFYFLLYLLFIAAKPETGRWGLIINDPTDIRSYRIVLAFFSILLILFFISFFFVGKKYLFKCKNMPLTFISCFSSYGIIAFKILRSNTYLAFTRPYLDILFKAIYMKAQDLTPPLSDAEFVIWNSEMFDRHSHAFELATSNGLNALFALLPFVIMFIGLLETQKKHKRDGSFVLTN